MIDYFLNLPVFLKALIAVTAIILFALPAIKEEYGVQKYKIFCVIKSEYENGVPVWTYLCHYTDRFSADLKKKALQEENDNILLKRGRVVYKVIPLTVRYGFSLTTGNALLKKEYNRRAKQIIKGRHSMSYLF